MMTRFCHARRSKVLPFRCGWLRAIPFIILLVSLSGGLVAPQAVAPQPVTAQGQLDPYALISQASLFEFLTALVNVQPYSGWRGSATEGEAEAQDYIASTLGEYAYLQSLGLEVERQSFHVFTSTEMWETRLFLTVQGQEVEVPADAIRGSRHDPGQALRCDSDGELNDQDRNPVEAAGEMVLIRSVDDADRLERDDAQGKIVLLDYAAVDPNVWGPAAGAQAISALIGRGIAGLVLVTQFSEDPEASHGGYTGDGFVLERVSSGRTVPTLYARLEDLSPAGIASWDDLAQVENARMIWDTDVFAPGTSHNLVVRIPGVDPSQAVILGAHVDSSNSPGAMDNGVNSAALIEVARVLNEAQIQPAVDLVLVWFGSEELGLYGSQHFVNTHQALLDRTIAALLLDGIIESVPGPMLTLDGWSHSRFGDARLTYARYLADGAESRQIVIDEISDIQSIGSDHSVFSGFVPQAMLSFASPWGGYAHSPYDTVETARELGPLMEQVASVVLMAALETGRELPDVRVVPVPERRALIVASHMEVAHMSASTLIDLERALAWEGFDVDVIPYGQVVTPADLEDTALVVTLPVIDLPSAAGDVSVYDESWDEAEIEALVQYVEAGGLLVLTNTDRRLYFGRVMEANEDRSDANALAERFGVVYGSGVIANSRARIAGEHPLTDGQTRLVLTGSNGVPFTMQTGTVLAETGSQVVAGLVDFGDAGGQVLVLADVSMLDLAGFLPAEADNLGFLRNLAAYARERQE